MNPLPVLKRWAKKPAHPGYLSAGKISVPSILNKMSLSLEHKKPLLGNSKQGSV
jgi:hypothetical protein